MISFIKVKQDNYETYINVNQITTIIFNAKRPGLTTICIGEEEYTVQTDIRSLMDELAIGTTILKVVK